MDLTPNGSCSLCDENTSVFSKKEVQPYITTVGKVFFNADKNGFKQFQDELCLGTICSLCVQKISSCTRFKNSYEEAKQDGFKKPRACFVCEKRGLGLIRTSDDPNDIIAKFTLFNNYSSNNVSYEHCEICLDCLYIISSWCDVHNTLIKKLNIDGQALKTFQHPNRNANISDNGILKKDKENVTPPHNNIQVSNKKLRTANVEKNSPKSSKKKFKQSLKNGKKLKRLSNDFSVFLSKLFKNVKCVRDGNFNELNWPKSILSDPKMYMQIPYINILQNDIQPDTPKRNLRRSKIETISISDSDTEPLKKPTRVSFKLPAVEIVALPPIRKPITYSCNICDKGFVAVLDYKEHCLWHEKPQRCQIDVVRRELPTYVKASEYLDNRIPIEPATLEGRVGVFLDSILNKYIDVNESTSLVDHKDKDEEDKEESVPTCRVESPVETDLDANDVDDKSNSSDNENSEPNDNEETPSVNNDTAVCDPVEDDAEGKEESEHDNLDNSETDVSKDNATSNDIEKALAQLYEDDEADVNDKEAESDRGEVSDDDGEGSNEKEESFNDEKEESSNEKEKSSNDKDAVNDSFTENGETLNESEEIVAEKGDVSDDKSDVSDDTEKHLKRKRVDSPTSENSDDQYTSDDNSPKLKKVRFAIDYSYAKLTGEEAAAVSTPAVVEDGDDN